MQNERPQLAIARSYVAAGLSVIPIGLNGSKRPEWSLLPEEFDEAEQRYKSIWYPFQYRMPTDAELTKWFNSPRMEVGIALVAGAISGGAECIDIDKVELVGPYVWAVQQDYPELYEKLVCVRTGGGGAHIWYRCAEIEGNKKLAWPAKGTQPFKTMIETRGEGGYAVAPGSPEKTHESGRPYVCFHRSLVDIAEISIDERNYLLRLAKGFNEGEERREGNPPPAAADHPGTAAPAGPGVLNPADDYDRRGPSFEELLTEAGARLCSGNWDRGMLVRPGKEKGPGATVGYSVGKHGEPLLHVFTSNWPPFEVDRNYGRFHVYRLLKHNGDGTAAMRALRAAGYGSPYKPKQAAPERPAVAGVVPPIDQPQARSVPRLPGSVEPWEPPIAIECAGDSVEKFPLGCLPKELADLAVALGESINCPVDYPASYILGLASGAIAATRQIEIKPEYCESACVYLVPVGEPNSGKSPPLKILKGCIDDEQERRRKNKSQEGPAFVGDITVEKVAQILKEHPRGLLLCRDEISAWMRSMNQYKATKGSGSDRQFYLACWSGESVNVERKDPTSEPVFVRYPHVSVVGTIQPDVLDELRGSNDGFYDRILFVYPHRLPALGENWRCVPDGLIKRWHEIYRLLAATKMLTGENGVRPFFHKMNMDARAAWEFYTCWLASKMNDPEFPDFLRGPAGKLKAYGARLALISHALREATSDNPGAEIDGEDMRRGTELAKYFFSHLSRVYRIFRADQRLDAAKKILGWIRQSDKPIFSSRDVHRSLRRSFDKPEDLYAPLKLLEQLRYIRYEDVPYSGVGRRPSIRYEINPLWTDWVGQAADRARGLLEAVRAQEAADAARYHQSADGSDRGAA